MVKSVVQKSLTQNNRVKDKAKIKLQRFSYRFAEQVLNSKLALKDEIESILLNPDDDISILTRKDSMFNRILDKDFSSKGWQSQPYVFNEDDEPSAKLDFYKDRIGIEVEFGHPSFIGIDLLKFQLSSYSALDKIDVGVYVTLTKNFQKYMKQAYGHDWKGSLNYEKVIKYLPYFKSAIQVPIYVYGIDI